MHQMQFTPQQLQGFEEPSDDLSSDLVEEDDSQVFDLDSASLAFEPYEWIGEGDISYPFGFVDANFNTPNLYDPILSQNFHCTSTSDTTSLHDPFTTQIQHPSTYSTTTSNFTNISPNSTHLQSPEEVIEYYTPEPLEPIDPKKSSLAVRLQSRWQGFGQQLGEIRAMEEMLRLKGVGEV